MEERDGMKTCLTELEEVGVGKSFREEGKEDVVKVTSFELSEKEEGSFTIKTGRSGDWGKTRLVDFRHS